METIELLSQIQGYRREWVALRHQSHRHPGLGAEELATSDLVSAQLTAWGFQFHRGRDKIGVVGQLRYGQAQRRIGLRADLDALPIPEPDRTALRQPCGRHERRHPPSGRRLWARLVEERLR